MPIIKKNKNKSELSKAMIGYKKFLKDLKDKIKTAQIKAVTHVNQELIKLYWEIGHNIALKEKEEGWGAKVIDQLAQDLRDIFPSIRGFSRRNLYYMRRFADAYPTIAIVQQLAAQIPWGHTMILLDRLEDDSERLWYAKKVLENGWSRNVLVHWIESDLYRRQGKAITNFKETLPQPQSDLAEQALKDPYCLDFLMLKEKALERDLEDALILHIQKFLLELGTGFAFIGRQYPLNVEDEDYFLDLLFYHYQLKCFIIIELKTSEFKAEYAGKMNFYLSAVDDQMKKSDDNPSIGIILCKSKKRVVVEYALRNVRNPIGVSSYKSKLVSVLPKELKGKLPSIEELKKELATDEEDI